MRIPTKPDSLQHLRPLQIKTVIDVGVGRQTSSLLQVFPDCEHILIEKDAAWIPTYRKTYASIRHRTINMEAGSVGRVDEIDFAGPALLKIDVDGAELDVIRGSENALHKIAAVVIESTAPNLSATLECLTGFDLFDIVDLAYCGAQLHQCDLVLVNRRCTDQVFTAWSIDAYQPANQAARHC